MLVGHVPQGKPVGALEDPVEAFRHVPGGVDPGVAGAAPFVGVNVGAAAGQPEEAREGGVLVGAEEQALRLLHPFLGFHFKDAAHVPHALHHPGADLGPIPAGVGLEAAEEFFAGRLVQEAGVVGHPAYALDLGAAPVQDQDLEPGPGQEEGGGKPRGAASHHDHVPHGFGHCSVIHGARL